MQTVTAIAAFLSLRLLGRAVSSMEWAQPWLDADLTRFFLWLLPSAIALSIFKLNDDQFSTFLGRMKRFVVPTSSLIVMFFCAYASRASNSLANQGMLGTTLASYVILTYALWMSSSQEPRL
jgi:hypothetical protein